MTVLRGRSYKAFIDGGAANERRTKSFLRLLGSWPPGWFVGTKKRLWNWGFGLGAVDCCLTIESEERETWTADVLADVLHLRMGEVKETI
ncbi:hypothetical protein [Methylosinus sporium]|uniref:hypothetical protein n=1 Tax=Methylosinus sporium TaxID=428 RepID=UPI003839CFCB